MLLSEKSIQEFKDIFEKEQGKEITWAEASEMAHNLMNYVKVIYDSAEKDHRLKLRLEKEPKGFHLEGEGYTCFICGQSVSNEQTWYDKHGIKCLVCQKAVDKKIIPATAASNKDSWYSTYDLESRFNINRHMLKRFVKEGVLRPRIVPSDSGGMHAQIFLIKDNKDTLPPKKVTESQLVKETRDGKDWYHSEPWYKFVDALEVLKDYKLINYLQVKKDDV